MAEATGAAHSKPAMSDSEFYMWRAVFSFTLVDNTLSLEEQSLLDSYLKTASFSKEQLNILKNDFKHPQNVEGFYKKITRSQDKERFCVLARALVWCEGDMAQQEERILKKVSCLANGADDDVLMRTRRYPHLDEYYQQYSRAGVVGLMKIQPYVQMSV